MILRRLTIALRKRLTAGGTPASPSTPSIRYPNRFEEKVVDELDDAGFFGRVEFAIADLAFDGRNLLTPEGIEGVTGDSVVSSDELSEITLVREDQFHSETGQQTEFVEGTQFERITGRDLQRVARPPDRNAELLEHQPRRKNPKGLFIDLQFGEIDDRHVELTSDRLEHPIGSDVAQTNQRVVQSFAGSLLFEDRLVQLWLGDEPAFDEDRSNTHEKSSLRGDAEEGFRRCKCRRPELWIPVSITQKGMERLATIPIRAENEVEPDPLCLSARLGPRPEIPAISA